MSSTILSEASNSETFLTLDSGSFPNCDDDEGLFAQYLRSPTSSVIGDDDEKENTAVVSKISPEISQAQNDKQPVKRPRLILRVRPREEHGKDVQS